MTHMKKIMFYSFKGGSGRTVAAANVAASLAKQGKRVLIIDMDFEAPGLHVVFDAKKTDKFKQKIGIQDYFLDEIELDQVREKIIIDLSTEKKLDKLLDFSSEKGNGCLLYMLAANRVSEVFSNVPDIYNKMELLLSYLGDKEDLDYIILDAASGIREAFTLSISNCDRLLIFFRWSKQHFDGTMYVAKLLRQMKPLKDSIFRPFNLIASAVPQTDELEHLELQLGRALKNLRNTSIGELKTELKEDGDLFAEIPEITELKWQESVISLENEGTTYEEIALKLLAEE